MSLYGLTRGFYAYVSDDGNTYNVAITADDADAGDFGDPVAAHAHPTYPRGWKMRIQYGVNGTTRTKWPVSSVTSDSWTTPVVTTKHAVAFTPEGTRGEQRYTRS
jgi:hypothetical protein